MKTTVSPDSYAHKGVRPTIEYVHLAQVARELNSKTLPQFNNP